MRHHARLLEAASNRTRSSKFPTELITLKFELYLLRFLIDLLIIYPNDSIARDRL